MQEELKRMWVIIMSRSPPEGILVRGKTEYARAAVGKNTTGASETINSPSAAEELASEPRGNCREIGKSNTSASQAQYQHSVSRLLCRWALINLALGVLPVELNKPSDLLSRVTTFHARRYCCEGNHIVWWVSCISISSFKF